MLFGWLRAAAGKMVRSARRGSVPRVELLEDRRLLSGGLLDPGFGSGGIVTGQFAGWTNHALEPAVLPGGGDLVLVGSQAMRFLPDGTPDARFGSGGVLGLDFQAAALAVQADGGFVVVGKTTAGFFDPGHFQVERFTPPGALDTSFGSAGKVVTAFGSNDSATAVAVQADGKIVVVGSDNIPTVPDVWSAQEDFAVERLNADGSPDGTFGTAGRVTIDVNASADWAAAVAVQADGKIVVAGTTNGPTFRGPWAFALARLNADGRPDAAFGTAGLVTAAPGLSERTLAGLALQADGGIVIAGGGTDGLALLARFTARGLPDAGFGTLGQVTDLPLAPGGLALESDGAILVTGDVWGGVGQIFALARFLPGGALDTGFGTGGMATTDPGFGSDDATAVLVQGSGAGQKILVAGSFSAEVPVSPPGAAPVGITNHFALVRYLDPVVAGDGTPPTANQLFVDQVYQLLLGRSAEPDALAAWGAILDRGFSRQWVALVIEQSPEYLTRVVDGLYQSILGRPADAVGRTGFVALLEAGAPVEQAKALLLGSAEFFAHAGGSNAAFLTALYQDLLGRPDDPSESQGFADALARGVSRTWVAWAIATSREAEQDLAAGYYREFLRRTADAAGLAGLTDALRHGMTDGQVIAALLASAEFAADLATA